MVPFTAAVVVVAGSCTPTPTNQVPVAVATATPSTGPAPLAVAFSSAGSSDPDGTIASYSWTFGDGGVSTAANPSHTYTTIATFTATLTVTDNAGASSTTITNVIVTSPGNQSPTAHAAATPTSGHAPLAVALSSTGSIDPDGTISSFDWDFGDGSPHSSVASPSHTYTSAGSYAAILVVTDNLGATGSDAVTVNVDPNQSPTAHAAATPTSGHAPLAVAFSSTGSSDPDGTISSFDWDFGDGSPHSSAASPSHTYTALGLHTASLTVTDNGGATDTATVFVQVNANQAPTASISVDHSCGPVPLSVAFTGSASIDNDGGIASYAWNFGDGNLSSLADVTHTFGSTGTFHVTLTVTDIDGATDVANVDITVGPPLNVPPTAAAGVTPVGQRVGLPFTFSSTGSSDSDGTISSYDWDFGDGSPHSSAASPTHSYSTANTYTATLTVTDNSGGTGSDTVQVLVTPNQAPVASVVATNTSGKAPLTASLNGSASSDPDGTIVSYDWDFGDGSPHGSTASLTHVYGVGTFTATLTVTDDVGATDSKSASVTAVANVAPVAILNSGSTSGKTPVTVSFDSSSSIDTDGTIASRSLDFGDGSPTSSATTVGHTYTSAGTYTATLTVTDDNGATDSATKTITVVDNAAPTASAHATPSSGTGPTLAVSFTSTGSTDSDGTIASYAWDFGDTGSASTASASHTYTAFGDYTAVLTVTDDNGATGTSSVVVHVTGATISPSSGPPLTVITVNVPCVADVGNPAATSVAALKTLGGTVLVSGSSTTTPVGHDSLTVPAGTPAGAYQVVATCNRYMTSTTYPAVSFTVT